MITLDEITEGYCLQHGIPESKYFLISQLGIRGLRLFHRDSTGFPQTTTLTVLGNGTAVLPTNALNKIAVGVLNNRGELASLTYDPLLSMFDAENPQRKQQVTEDTLIDNEQYIVEFQELQGGLVPIYGYGQYGVGSSGTIGFYNIDWEQRVMIFNFGFCQPTVEFVYLGLPCENGNYLVHPFFQEPLTDYINWQRAVGNPKISRGEKLDAKKDFDVSYNNARRALNPFDPSDIYNQYRQSIRLSVKV